MNGKHARSMIRTGWVLAPLTAVLATSCLSSGRSLPPSPREQMWAHFVQSAHLELSVAMGDLDAARDAARSIERVESIDGVPPEATPRLDGLRSRAHDVTLAQDLGELTVATAGLAAACGDCHRAYDGGPVFTNVAPAPDSDDVDHMVEHLWAADRMWEGLAIPSNEHWEAGARVLADHAVPMNLLPPGTRSLGVRLKSLGLEALRDRSTSTKVERYAQILETCATCHTAVGVR